MKIKDFIKHLQNIYNEETEIVNCVWSTEDITEHAKFLGFALSPEQVTEVIDWLSENEDAEIGINWDRIEFAIREILTERVIL